MNEQHQTPRHSLILLSISLNDQNRNHLHTAYNKFNAMQVMDAIRMHKNGLDLRRHSAHCWAKCHKVRECTAIDEQYPNSIFFSRPHSHAHKHKHTHAHTHQMCEKKLKRIKENQKAREKKNEILMGAILSI